jgi:hypothetical protein
MSFGIYALACLSLAKQTYAGEPLKADKSPGIVGVELNLPNISATLDMNLLSITPRTGDYTCSRLNPASLKYDCYSAIRGYSVDVYASGVCDRYTDSYTTLTCMQTIAGHTFKYSALAACDRFNDANETNSCLWSITDCSPSDGAVATCDAYASTADTISCFRYYCGR